jgi:hypothetical protein
MDSHQNHVEQSKGLGLFSKGNGEKWNLLERAQKKLGLGLYKLAPLFKDNSELQNMLLEAAGVNNKRKMQP